MKKIFIFLAAIIAVSAPQAADAQSIIYGAKRDTTYVVRNPGGLIQINRVNREIDKNIFAYKGEWMCGIAASYGTLSTDDSDIALVVENLKAGGSIVSVKPFIGYLYRNNLAIGLRLGYTRMAGHFDNANINLGNFINGIEFSTEGIGLDYLSNAYSFSIFHRAYVPLDRRGRFGVFGELELEGSYGRSRFGFMYNNEWNTSISDTYKVAFNFNPGIAAYVFPNVCASVSFGLGGLQYTHIKQFDGEMNPTGGTRNYSKLAFRLNITEINIGVTVHLWSKKNDLKLKQQHD
jgi:hypothetical protein